MLVSALSLVLLGPVGPTDPDTDVHECMHPDDPQVWSDVPDEPVSIAYDCTESKDTGYVKGDPFEITVVTVDGDPVEVETANAFIMLAEAAAADGVTLKINSGFRTMAGAGVLLRLLHQLQLQQLQRGRQARLQQPPERPRPRHQHLGQRRVQLAAGPRRRLRVDAHRPERGLALGVVGRRTADQRPVRRRRLRRQVQRPELPVRLGAADRADRRRHARRLDRPRERRRAHLDRDHTARPDPARRGLAARRPELAVAHAHHRAACPTPRPAASAGSRSASSRPRPATTTRPSASSRRA
jgi:hypothetical protein